MGLPRESAAAALGIRERARGAARRFGSGTGEPQLLRGDEKFQAGDAGRPEFEADTERLADGGPGHPFAGMTTANNRAGLNSGNIGIWSSHPIKWARRLGGWRSDLLYVASIPARGGRLGFKPLSMPGAIVDQTKTTSNPYEFEMKLRNVSSGSIRADMAASAPSPPARQIIRHCCQGRGSRRRPRQFLLLAALRRRNCAPPSPERWRCGRPQLRACRGRGRRNFWYRPKGRIVRLAVPALFLQGNKLQRTAGRLRYKRRAPYRAGFRPGEPRLCFERMSHRGDAGWVCTVKRMVLLHQPPAARSEFAGGVLAQGSATSVLRMSGLCGQEPAVRQACPARWRGEPLQRRLSRPRGTS